MDYSQWKGGKKLVTRDGEVVWLARDEKALAIIGLGLSDGYIHHITNIEDAIEAWDTLDRIFGAKGKHSKISFKDSILLTTNKRA